MVRRSMVDTPGATAWGRRRPGGCPAEPVPREYLSARFGHHSPGLIPELLLCCEGGLLD